MEIRTLAFDAALVAYWREDREALLELLDKLSFREIVTLIDYMVMKDDTTACVVLLRTYFARKGEGNNA